MSTWASQYALYVVRGKKFFSRKKRKGPPVGLIVQGSGCSSSAPSE